jgi:hypothetical protein
MFLRSAPISSREKPPEPRNSPRGISAHSAVPAHTADSCAVLTQWRE